MCVSGSSQKKKIETKHFGAFLRSVRAPARFTFSFTLTRRESQKHVVVRPSEPHTKRRRAQICGKSIFLHKCALYREAAVVTVCYITECVLVAHDDQKSS